MSNQPNTNEQVIIEPNQIVPGVYQIEVYGYSESQYRLEVTVAPATTRVRTNNRVGTISGNKPLPTDPVLPVSSVPDEQQGSTPPPTTSDSDPSEHKLYLPAITR